MTKQTDTSAETVESACRNIHDAVNRNKLPAYNLVWVDLLRALVAERNEWKTRAERSELALVELHEVSKRAVRLSLDYGDFKLYAMEPMERAIDTARAALAQIDANPAEPGHTLADAYRAGLEAAAKRHVYYAHQYERINAIADAAAHREHARQTRALDVPTEFGETNDQ